MWWGTRELVKQIVEALTVHTYIENECMYAELDVAASPKGLKNALNALTA
ncbi:hypothetical protein AB0J74_26615 [Asanoa sp. NPDC049573]